MWTLQLSSKTRIIFFKILILTIIIFSLDVFWKYYVNLK